MTTKTACGLLLGLCAISGFAGYTAVLSEEELVSKAGVTETAVILPILPVVPEFEVVQIPPSEEEHIEKIPLDKSAKPVILHRHSEKVRNAIKAIMPIAIGARVVAVERPPVMRHAHVSQVVPGSSSADESETPRPTTTFCRKIGNLKSPAARKEICFERDDILRKVVRTYEMK